MAGGGGAYAGDVTALRLVQLTPDPTPGAGRDGSNASIGGTPPPPPPPPPATLLLAGIGSQLHVYSLPAGRLCGCATVLPDAVRVHGIACLPVPPSSGSCARSQVLAAVHGRQHAAFVRLLGPAAHPHSGSGGWEVQPLLLLPLSMHRPWTMDVQLSWGSSPGTVLLAVGLSSNALEVFSIRPDAPGCPATRVLHAECTDRSLLYSLALAPRSREAAQQPEQQPEEQQQQRSGSSSGGGTHWLVAAGTILLDVLVWATHDAASCGPAVGPDAPALLAPLLRLKGHEGSIHRVCWSPCGRLLASGCDDRSLRLWPIPQLAPAGTPGGSIDSSSGRGGGGGSGGSAELSSPASPVELEARHVLWGHAGRLWDCCFGGLSLSGGAAAGGFLVTASQDCSCRVWCLETGSLLATVQGHRGRGIWRCALLQLSGAPAAAAALSPDAAAAAAAAACCLFTGGADGSIKAWRLSDWLPPGAPAAGLPAPAAECFMLRGSPPDPATVVVGEERAVQADAVQQPLPEQQEEPLDSAAAASARDSRAEWMRCLALLSADASGGGGGGGPGVQPWPRSWLYVGTNRGLLHRVQLPDAPGGQELWTCLLAPAASGSCPLLALQLLPEPAPAADVWLALCDLSGTATVLLDRPSSSSSSSSDGSTPQAYSCRWQPYGGGGGQVGIWWGTGISSSSGNGSSGRGGDTSPRGGLGSRVCFTALGSRRLLTLWQLPPPGAGQQQQEPARLAEVQLPFPGHINALAALQLPQQVGQRQAALVAVGDTGGAVTLLLLLLRQQPPHGAAASCNGSSSHACSSSVASLHVLAASRRVHDTPVRMVRLQLPPGGSLAHRLKHAEVTTAGGDGVLYTLRPPSAAVAAALRAAGGQVPAQGAEAAAAAAAAAASLPRLLLSRQQHCEAVAHPGGALPSPGGTSAAGAIWGFHANALVVWDDAAEAQVARLPCGGWRRPCAADVAGPDSLALAFLRDDRVWLYRRVLRRRRPDPSVPARSLRPPHHGKESECLRLLALPGAAAAGGAAAANGAASPRAAAAICCITGSEDALLRQLLHPLLPAQPAGDAGTCDDCSRGFSPSGAFPVAAPLAEQVFGTAVKALAVVPFPAADAASSPTEWLLVSAGARQTLMACRLRQQEARPAAAAAPHGLLGLLCDELAVKGPVLARRGKAQQLGRADSELRYMSVSPFLWPPPAAAQQQVPPPQQQQPNGSQAGPPPELPGRLPLIFVAAAASDASLALLCADPSAAQQADPWRTAAVLLHGSRLVICTAHCRLTVPGAGGSGDSQECHIVCSGATDGAIAVWDVTAAAAAAAAAAGGLKAGQQHAAELAPLLVLEGAHQSGVNAIGLVPAGPGRLLLLTGGDDQALRVALLQLGGGAGSNERSCRELLHMSIPSSHASALRAVWLGALAPPPTAAAAATAAPGALGAAEATVFTLGLDQQVRRWRVLLEQLAPERPDSVADGATTAANGCSSNGTANGTANGHCAARYTAAGGGWALAVEEVGCRFTQVCEPAALDVVPLHEGSGRHAVGVAGRGTELLPW